ncbi:MAG TPA: 2-hydroxyacyl-CoA dehydratase family protein [Deltaproteobacteria bacterium]|nr:2-hydroxyacyl-CoA dehydratase family protein [Deltaproteobacteria bacterium]
MEAIQVFQRAVDDPGGYLKTIKAERKIIGYCCTYTPEEIIFAAGAHPVRLFGTKGKIHRADAHLQAYSCSLVRGVLEDALAGNLESLDGMVFPHTCDSIQRLSDIWRLNIASTWHNDVVLPVKLNTESAQEYLLDVLKKFRRELEAWSGAPLDDAALHEAIVTYNRLRALLKRVYELKSVSPGIISGRAVNAMIKGAMIMDRRAAIGHQEGLVRTLETATGQTPRREAKRTILAGSICNHPEIYDIVENAGADVVWDELCTGSRFFEGPIDEDGDPLAAIARRYMNRMNCPAKHKDLRSRGETLVRMAQDHAAGGVIFLNFKFCEPHAFDYPYLKEMLQARGVPSLLLEIDQELPASGQLATRIEAFIETM